MLVMETVQRVRPTPTYEYLANPHKGCCTFQHFNGDVLFDGVRWSEEGPVEFPPRVAAGVIDGYLPSTVKDLDIRTWLPGDFCMDTKVALPKGLQRGVVELSLDLIDPVTQEPKVSFAVKERFSDRWTRLGIVEVV